jgi:hypothetical protein
MRLFAIAQAMYLEDYTVDRIHDLTKIDKVSSAPLLCLHGYLEHSHSGYCTSLRTLLTHIEP